MAKAGFATGRRSEIGSTNRPVCARLETTCELRSPPKLESGYRTLDPFPEYIRPDGDAFNGLGSLRNQLRARLELLCQEGVSSGPTKIVGISYVALPKLSGQKRTFLTQF